MTNAQEFDWNDVDFPYVCETCGEMDSVSLPVYPRDEDGDFAFCDACYGALLEEAGDAAVDRHECDLAFAEPPANWEP